MIALAKLAGILILVIGAAVVASPKLHRRMLDFWRQGKNIYIIGGIRIAVGVILLLVAPQSRFTGGAIGLGIIFILSGILAFAIGEEHKGLIAWWSTQNDLAVRLLGLMAVGFGALILYAV